MNKQTDRMKNLQNRHDVALRAIEKAKEQLWIAQERLNQAHVELGRANMLIDLEEMKQL